MKNKVGKEQRWDIDIVDLNTYEKHINQTQEIFN